MAALAKVEAPISRTVVGESKGCLISVQCYHRKGLLTLKYVAEKACATAHDAYSRASAQGGLEFKLSRVKSKWFFLRKRLARFQTARIMRDLGKGNPLTKKSVLAAT